MNHSPHTIDQTDKEAFTVPQFRASSGLSESYIYAAMADGRLRAVKAGRRTLILKDDGRAFLAAMPAYQSKGRAPRSARAN